MHYPTTSMQYTSRKMKYIQHEPEWRRNCEKMVGN
jgi:hypothetical protein